MDIIKGSGSTVKIEILTMAVTVNARDAIKLGHKYKERQYV